MEIKEAIWRLKEHFRVHDDGRPTPKLDEACKIAYECMEKQLPKKPIIKSEKEVPRTHNLGRLLRFHCPNCGRFIVGMYEKDVERGGGISNHLKGCSTCLQAIDFSEYYTKRDIGNNKLNEDIEWVD